MATDKTDEAATAMFQAKVFPGTEEPRVLQGLPEDVTAIVATAMAEAFGVFVNNRDAVAIGEVSLARVIQAVNEQRAVHERAAVHGRLEQCIEDLRPLFIGASLDTNESPEVVWPRLVEALKGLFERLDRERLAGPPTE